MRRLYGGILALTFAAFTGGAAEAQIRLVPGPQKLVSFSPKFIVADFFNGDPYEDAAVTSAGSTKISSLLGQATGNSFGQATDFNIGRTLRGLTTADFNEDGIQDIAVTDYLDSKLFIANGNPDRNCNPLVTNPCPGDGTFSITANQTGFKAGLHPVDVAAGSFSSHRHNDLMVVDAGSNKVTVFTNSGGIIGNVQTYNVGSRPKRGVTGDLTGDGLDEIIVINTGTRSADDVSILYNKDGVFNAASAPPANYIVGAGAADVIVADFNNDGAPDLAVLNTGINAVQTTFTVSILINQTMVTADGKTVGTGSFTAAPNVNINCPATIAGVAIFCHPNYLAAGDFDGDGFTDFAVSVLTQPQSGTVTTATAGLIQAFQGNGDGTFQFSTQVTVGNNPQGLASGDFNGDGIKDLVVAEQGTRTVRIVTALPPPPIPVGGTCTLTHQCATGLVCIDGVCCDTGGQPACPQGLFCDIPGNAGTCTLPGAPGEPCTDPDGHQCAAPHICFDGFCCTSACTGNLVCNTGVCAPPAPNGTPCNSQNESGGANQCASGHCTDGVCCQDDRCPAGAACNIPDFEGVCTQKLPIGSSCSDDAQCAPPTPGPDSGFCTDGFCCVVRACPDGESCGIEPAHGFCSLAPTRTPTLTATPTMTPTPTAVPIGGACGPGSRCAPPNACVDGVCCSQTSCPDSQRCDITGSVGVCAPQKPTGGSCSDDTDCTSGNCDLSSHVCGPARTPTRTPTLTPTLTPAPGNPCGDQTQCPPGFTCSATEHVCCNIAPCTGAFSCKVPGSEGFCTELATPTRTPTPLHAIGTPCTTGAQCDSGFCTDLVCCTEGPCPVDGEKCNIYTLEGVCTLPGNEGDPCNKNPDCNPLLVCDRDNNICIIPVPTPTFVVPTWTPGPSADVHTSSSGGCSIDDRSDRAAAWVLAAVAFLLWTRRSRLQRVGVRAKHTRNRR